MTADELQARIATLERENATLRGTLTQERQQRAAHDAARALGWNATVLETITRARGLHIEFRDGVALARPAADAAAAMQPLDALVRADAPDFLPALEAERSRDAPDSARSRTPRAVSEEAKARKVASNPYRYPGI